jgi:integrase
MREFSSRDNLVVKVLDEDHWIVPSWEGSLPKQWKIDFSVLPHEVRSWWCAVLERAYESISISRASGIWKAAMWLTRFLREHDMVTTNLDSFDEVDWGIYLEWLKEQDCSNKRRTLSFHYRKQMLDSLIEAAKQANLLGLSGTSETTVDRLRTVRRNLLRGGADIVRETIEQRALTGEQYTELYTMMSEEWQRYLDSKNTDVIKANLPGLVACWLAFNDGVRSSEINALSVDDLQVDEIYGKHRLHMHAPNKNPDMVPIERDTLLLLQAMIEEGAAARFALGTNLLFTSVQGEPRVLTTPLLNYAVRRMIRQQECTRLPHDLKLPDGRTTLGTHLTYTIHNRERVRRIMRHKYARTTEIFYKARQKLVVAGSMAKALRAEALRLTIACQRPVITIAERPDQADIIERNPENAELEWGSCGRDIQLQGACRSAKHCFECPLLVPWVSKRHNYVAERDEYLRMAELADNLRDRENRLYHANLAHAHIILIDRRLRLEEQTGDTRSESTPTRQRRPRRTSHSSSQE